MATIPGALLLGLSSPYARRGTLWEAYSKHFGREGSILVWQAPTEAMNPTVPPGVIARAYEADPASAAAEYGAQFRSDVEAFLPKEAVENCTPPGVTERPPVPGLEYVAFVDPSGGSQDAMTIAVAHQEGGKAVLDCIRERRPPFSPDAVTAEFAAVLKSYGLHEVRGDRYGGQWPAEKFQEHGIYYRPSEKTKNEIYLEFLPVVSAKRAELLDNERLINQLCTLERRTNRGGRDSVDHPPRGHDDLANVAAGALVAANCITTPADADDFLFGRLGGEEKAEEWRDWVEALDQETPPWMKPY